MVAGVQVGGVLGPDDDVEGAGAHPRRELLGGLGVVAGHLQGAIEGVLEVLGDIALDGRHAHGAVLRGGLDGQDQGAEQQSARGGGRGQARHEGATARLGDELGQAAAAQGDQEAHADRPAVGGEGQDR